MLCSCYLYSLAAVCNLCTLPQKKLFGLHNNLITFISTGFLIFLTCSDFMLTLPLCSQMEEYGPGPDNQSIPSLQPQQLRDGNEIW